MCSYIVMKAALVDSSAKGAKGWMRVDTANVYYDHPFHAPLDHALGIDFVTRPKVRASGSRLSSPPNPPAELIKQIEAALANGEREHAIAVAANKTAETAEACAYLT